MPRITKTTTTQTSSNTQQICMTYILGYEGIKNVNINSAPDVRAALPNNPDSISTLIAAFKIRVNEVEQGSGSIADLAAWCDSLAYSGDRAIDPTDYACMEKEIANMAPCLRVISPL